MERALQAELAAHVGHDSMKPWLTRAATPVTAAAPKRSKAIFGALPVKIPRDRDGSFEPQLIGKHQTPWPSFDDKIPIS
ncbi:transposase [Undibacterium arcticum]